MIMTLFSPRLIVSSSGRTAKYVERSSVQSVFDDHQRMAHDGLQEAQIAIQSCAVRRVHLGFDQNILAFILLADGVSKTTLAPQVDLVDLSLAFRNPALYAFDDLFERVLVQVRVDDEN